MTAILAQMSIDTQATPTPAYGWPNDGDDPGWFWGYYMDDDGTRTALTGWQWTPFDPAAQANYIAAERPQDPVQMVAGLDGEETWYVLPADTLCSNEDAARWLAAFLEVM